MDDQVIIQHRFFIPEDKTNEIPAYNGAIVLPIDQYEALSDQDKEGLKTQFYNGYVNAIKKPPPSPPELPIEEKIAAIDNQIEDLTQQKEALLQGDQ